MSPTKSSEREIADRLRTAILSGKLAAGDKLPVEQDLANRFGVSRSTIREALKRLAAQNLIRTRRGNAGGSFVQGLTWDDARQQLAATTTALVHLAPIAPDQVAEARLGLLCACAPLAIERRDPRHLEAMRREVAAQRANATTDRDFCASDARFNRVFADSAANPLLSYQMTCVIEAIQPMFDRISISGNVRAEIAARHARVVAMLERRNLSGLIVELTALAEQISHLVRAARSEPAGTTR